MTLIETTRSSERLVDGVLLKVYRDVAVLPSGGEGVREWIQHPGASAVVPLFADGSTVLLRQFRYPPRREFLEVPAGKLDVPGEDPLAVARRELAEEAGLQAARWTPLGSIYPCIGYSDEVIHLFLAEDLAPAQGHTEDDEFVEPLRLPFRTALEQAVRGEILDVKSEIALRRAADLLHREGRMPG